MSAIDSPQIRTSSLCKPALKENISERSNKHWEDRGGGCFIQSCSQPYHPPPSLSRSLDRCTSLLPRIPGVQRSRARRAPRPSWLQACGQPEPREPWQPAAPSSAVKTKGGKQKERERERESEKLWSSRVVRFEEIHFTVNRSLAYKVTVEGNVEKAKDRPQKLFTNR